MDTRYSAGSGPVDPAHSDRLRFWGALNALWEHGLEEEARRLSPRFVGQQAILRDAQGSGLQVTLQDTFIQTNLASPRGFDVYFYWNAEGPYSGLNHISELELL
jgi:hypothetical protein